MKTNSCTSLPAAFNSDTRMFWNRVPNGMPNAICEKRFVSFSIGPAWQAAHAPCLRSTKSTSSSKNRRPRFSEAVLPRGRPGAAPPAAKILISGELKNSLVSSNALMRSRSAAVGNAGACA